MTIRDRLAQCREAIAQAAQRVGRSPDDVVLIGVTKNVSLDCVREALEAGLHDIGENRLQEAKEKFGALSGGPAFVRHMIGHLQTNKVKDALRHFDLIHSVDSMTLAREIDKRAAQISKVQDILLEVNVSGEISKNGFSVPDVREALDEIIGFKNVRVRGLMTVAPIADDPEKVRPVFRGLKELGQELFVHRPSSIVHRPFLSMGMSDDFQTAVEEGATHVRLGRAIFGEREK
jgi:pyridoxal phosphate enzyme (YggS family)